MNSFAKLACFCLATSLTAMPALAQTDSVGEVRRQLATLREREVAARQRLGQLQLDALIAKMNRAVERRAAARPLTLPVALWTPADLSM